ncbi:23S rRNA m(5)U1939 methyltransferase, partial [Alcaligenes faecalis subsp. faecalis NCIB 8687]
QSVVARRQGFIGFFLREDADKLAYALPEFDLRMPYRPTDFTQVNHDINRSLISRALTLLDEPFAGVDPIAVIEIQRIVQFLKGRNIGALRQRAGSG